MSKLLSISNNNNKLYKTFNTMTPPRRGKEEKSLSDNSIEVNDPSNSDKNKNQNQKAILSTLLKTLLDKSLKKLEPFWESIPVVTSPQVNYVLLYIKYGKNSIYKL